MKRLLLVLSMAVLPIIASQVSAENFFNQPRPHLPLYGEEGVNLFPVDSDGFAEISGIVECPGKSVEEIKNAVIKWYNYMILLGGLEVNNDEKVEARNQLLFKGKFDLENLRTDVYFVAKIDIKDGKFRYTFSQIVADRYRLPGKPETSGFLNDIHWQRVNCLKSDLENKAFTQQGKKEIEDQIKYEEYLYREEFSTMTNMVERLKICWKEEKLDF